MAETGTEIHLDKTRCTDGGREHRAVSTSRRTHNRHVRERYSRSAPLNFGHRIDVSRTRGGAPGPRGHGWYSQVMKFGPNVTGAD